MPSQQCSLHGRKACEGVKTSLENRNSLTQRRKVAKVAEQTKEFLLSDLCAFAPWRDAFSFFHCLYTAFPSVSKFGIAKAAALHQAMASQVAGKRCGAPRKG